MPKPVTLPRWIATGKRAVPSTLKQDNGWDAGEQPPNVFANEHLANTYEWIQYLNTIEGETHAWTALNSFTNLDKAHVTTDYNRLSWDNRTRFLNPGMESNGSSVSVTPPNPGTNNPGGWTCPGAGTYDLYVPMPMDENEYIKTAAFQFENTTSQTSTITLEVLEANSLLGAGSCAVIGSHVVTGFLSAASLLVNGSSSPVALPNSSSASVKRTISRALWFHAQVVIAGGSGKIFVTRYTTGRLAV